MLLSPVALVRPQLICVLSSLLISSGCERPVDSMPSPGASATPSSIIRFDAERAYQHVKNMVEIGPRPSGSEGIKKAQDYIQRELKSHGLTVREDSFQAQTPRGPIPMKNIIGELNGERPEVVIIAGHYDTKLMPEFVGANDAGSSTAAVLETARVLANTRPEYTIWFVFFDGEEAVVDWGAMGGLDNTYGSRHMVDSLKAQGALKNIKAMILYDMVGDKNLDIKRDGASTEWLVDLIWRTAREIGHGKYFLDNMHYIEDDHIPFEKAGVPAVDLIDFNFGPDNSYWHTTQDNLDKVSGESIRIVGDVVISALPALFKELKARSVARPNK